MKRLPLLLALGILHLPAAVQADNNWPAWRGPAANGTAPDADPPVEWSEGKNVKWKVAIPGSGTSTPVIWGNRIFLTTAIPTGKKSAPAAEAPATPPPPAPEGGRRERRGPGGGGGGMRGIEPTEVMAFTVLCLDRATGKTLWQKAAEETLPHEGHHADHGYASHSPVTDGTFVYAYFGSRGLHCYDLEGNLKWSRDFGRMQTRAGFGEGSSPLLAGDFIVVNWDHEGEDFIVALDRKTGEEKWRRKRDEPTSWATPVLAGSGGKPQVVTSASNRVRSYDLASGSLLWECGGMTANVIPTPVVSGDLVLAISGFRGNALRAIRVDGSGDVSGTDKVVWSYDSKTPYVPSPLLSQGRLWFFSNNTGILTALDAATGKVLIDAERIPELTGVYASPVAAGGRIYLTGRNGECIVIRDAEKLEVLATNKLSEKIDASPAVSGRLLFLRGHESLYCLSAE